MVDYTRINVSKDGKYLFATEQGHLTYEWDAKPVYELFKEKFPESEGYEVTVTKMGGQRSYARLGEGVNNQKALAKIVSVFSILENKKVEYYGRMVETMENIKVSYNENWDCEGYHTTQNIRLSENLLKRFNIFLADCRKPIEIKHLITNDEMKLLAYGQSVGNLNRCLHLTQLKLLYQFLMQNHIDCSRVKTDRNTMLVIG